MQTAPSGPRRLFSLLVLTALPLLGFWGLSLSAAQPTKFRPPTPAEQQTAIGPTNGLSPLLARALQPTSQFTAIPEPKPQDWLGAHREPGQTYQQFVSQDYHRPNRQRRTIYLQPLGQFPPDQSPPLESLRAFAATYFSLETKLLPAREIDPDTIASRRNPFTRQRQLHAGDLMQALAERLPAPAYCLLGITMTDLYPEPSWNFVFGMAALRERVGVYSFARYDPAFLGGQRGTNYQQVILRRSCQVLAHETGHMFGLQHCIHFACLMNGSNHLAESDAQPLFLCPVCLRKLHHSVGFDLLARYRALQTLCTKLGLGPEAQWYQQRLQFLESP